MPRVHLTTDLLVIGAGGTGMIAAIEAAQAGRDVLLVDRSLIGRGGATIMAQMTVAVALGEEVPDSVDAHLADTLAAGRGLCDERLSALICEDGPAAIRQMDAWKVGWARHPDGRIKSAQAPGHDRPRCVYVDFLSTGPAVSRTLRAQVQRTGGIRRIGDLCITHIVVDGGIATGAVGFSLADGRPVSIAAQATIVATGGLTRLYRRNSASANMGGDGYALALRAGAELIDMEFVQFEPTVVTEPTQCRGMEMPTAMFADGATLRNAQGERFMFRHNPQHGEMQIEKAKIALAVQEEIDAGRGCRGAVFFDTSAIPRARLKTYVSHFTRLRNAGGDPSVGPILIKPAAHSQMGGIRIDPQCRTGVNGLLAAGEASGGVHGASRIAGNGASDAIIFGGIAGCSAAGMQSHPGNVPWEDVHRRALDAFAALESNHTGPSPDEIKDAVRKVMLSGVGIRRNAEDLSEALSALSSLRKRAAAGLRFERPSDRIRAHEAFGFITIGEVIARSALARRESRGAHWRVDFPARDDAHWLCHITARHSDAGAIEIGTAPIQ